VGWDGDELPSGTVKILIVGQVAKAGFLGDRLSAMAEDGGGLLNRNRLLAEHV
jgi:hypothetical protein